MDHSYTMNLLLARMVAAQLGPLPITDMLNLARKAESLAKTKASWADQVPQLTENRVFLEAILPAWRTVT